jgi:integrase/recombinase XerD
VTSLLKNMIITYKFIKHRGQNRILLLFDYDAYKTARLKENTDARWSKTQKGWHIADTVANRTACKLAPQEAAAIIANSSFDIVEKSRITLPGGYSILPTIKPSVFTDENNELRIELLFNKNQLLQQAVKKVKGVKWNSVKACWHIACTKLCYDELCSKLKGIAQIDEKILRAQLNKIKVLQHNAAGVQKTGVPKAGLLLHTVSHYNLQLLNAVMEYLQLKGYSTSTQKTYRNEIAVFLQTLKNVKADALATVDIKRYIHDCIHKQQLSENTIHSRLNALKFLYEQVLGHERFFVEIPRPKKHLQLPKVLGEDELRRLFASPKNLKHKAILFVAYSAGLRVSEVINLRLQDIDRERKQLFIHCSKGKKDRYVRLSPMVLDVLEQYYKMSEVKPTNYVFEGTEKGKPYTSRSAQQIFTDAKNKAGISKSLSFHNLRHSFATHLLEKGVDVLFIKEILGHFNIETTQRYLHVKKEFLINIESPLDDLYRDRPYI